MLQTKLPAAAKQRQMHRLQIIIRCSKVRHNQFTQLAIPLVTSTLQDLAITEQSMIYSWQLLQLFAVR